MQELNMVEIDAVSGGADADQTVVVVGKKMTQEEKDAYDQTPEGQQNQKDVAAGKNKT